MFKVGDKVSWESQAAGSWKAKVGEVIEVVAIGKRPSYASGGSGWGYGRIHESYVVRVDEVGKGKRPKRSRIYWPVVSKLTKA